ncbi:MAG: WG repeat-containing protein [Lachnospiraceae bacterium]|nr:WG repeat-containing protein [Lachnospiraceae bacterium]
MKKRVIALFLCAVFALGACGETEKPGRGSIEDAEADEEPGEKPEATPTEAEEPEPEPEPEPVEEELYGFTPLSQLDGMEVCGLLYAWRPIYGSDVSNTEPTVVKEHYYVVRDGDSFGLIDIEGNWIAEPVYAMVYHAFDYCVSTGYESDAEAYGVDHGELFALPEDAVYYDVNGTSPDGCLYWDDENERILYVDQSEMDGLVTEYEDSFACTTFRGRTTGDGGYGIVSGGSPVTDFVYENASAFSEGLCAVKRDGKWGYVDDMGNERIPCEYEGIRTTEYYEDRLYEYNSEMYPDYYPPEMVEEYISYWKDHFFAASCTDGCVALCRDGEYALYSWDNEELVPFGVFESISEVTDGKFFAKKDGVWGICTVR